MREHCDKGFFIPCDYLSDAVTEVGQFVLRTSKVIIPLIVRETLEEEIARKLT